MADAGSGHRLEPRPAALMPRVARAARLLWAKTRSYFLDQDPTFAVAFPPALIVAALLFVRSPLANYIFDEQEALLANPYVNGSGLGFLAAFERDFWGLPPGRSIGSYRPVPNLIWRSLWYLSESPWLLHWINVVVHAANAALLSALTFSFTWHRLQSWLTGAAFVTAAILTEAVTGVVGLADVLAGLGLLLAVAALRWRIPWMALGVFGALTLGLFSKESVIVAVPLTAWTAVVLASRWHPERPRRALRAVVALSAAVAALVAYTYFRRHFFPVTLPESLRQSLPDTEPLYRRALHEFLRWFQQPRLPEDPINNPLSIASAPEYRVAGALRVYWRGLVQFVFPWRLSGDYSYPQEPVPDQVIFPESVLGAGALVIPPIAALALWARSSMRERRLGSVATGRYAAALALALLWVPLSYFPHSNIPILLPTVRAERFWYLPAIGYCLALGALMCWLIERRHRIHSRLVMFVVVAFFGLQSFKARAHALDYANDLVFWQSTHEAAPNSAKAHLNYSVMLGARGRLKERLVINRRAIELAPRWAMAHVYYGDTLCRMRKPDEAWPHYERGFELAPNDSNLIALGLQCLWDNKAIDEARREKLLDLADHHPGTWLAYLGSEVAQNGHKHGGVEKKYRPRGYNEGPKQP